MTSIEDQIQDNLYEFYDSISRCNNLDSEKQEHWAVLANKPEYWPRLIYRIHTNIFSSESASLFSERIKSGSYPELLIAGPENISQTDPFLREQGFIPFSAWKGMAMSWSPNQILPEIPEAIEIVNPASISDKEQWRTIVNIELIAPLKLDVSLLESMLTQPEIEIFLLKQNGLGVSTCLLFRTKNSTGLYLIATLKSAQKQGLASLLIRYILAQNALESKKPIILHATPQGEPMYSKLGFESINHFFLYRQLNKSL